MNHFHPRKKKLSGPKVAGAMKSVRINSNTIICVPASLSDEEAKERFLKRTGVGCKAPDFYIPPIVKQDLAKVESVGLLEDLEGIVDETMKPDLE